MKMLKDITVLDLSRILAGPYCSQMLADLGATVWKIEPLSGDDTRRWGPPFIEGESAYYLSVNRGKKSIAVNLKTKEGQTLVQQLAKQADVLIENFKVGDLQRYGLDYTSLSKINSKLVYCSITGFGQTGPRSQEPGYDAALQAMSGLMSITGEAESVPVKVGVAVIDVLTGLHAAVAILAALHERNLTQQGKYLDISLLDVSLASLVNQAQATLMTGQNPKPLGSAHPQIVPYQAFETNDGYFMLAVGNDEQYRKFCEGAGCIELWHNSKFQTNAARVEYRQELIPKLNQITKTQSKSYWLELCKKASVPASPINTLTEVFEDEHVKTKGLIEYLEHPVMGTMPSIASPFKHSIYIQTSAPPLLGQHTSEVLSEALGLQEQELKRLKEDGAILGR